MKDRRLEQRRYLIYYLQVFNQETEKFLGNLVNITPEGMMLTSETPIEPGQSFKLRMNVQFLAREEISLAFTAESRWCKNDVNPDYYDTGFQLHSVDPDQRKLIDGLINEMGFLD